MAKRALARKPEKRERIIDLVVLWKSTPENMRKHKSLSELAKANDITPNTDFYSIANSPEVMMKVTTSIAGEELGEVKNVLAVLRDQAKTGHVRSAEVYLEWIRKIVTDASLMEYVKPAQDMNRTLKEISNGAKQMLKVAEKLKDNNDIDNFLQSKAVTADYRDANSLENQRTGEEDGQTSRPCLTETN
jgi:hypothetical protein